MGNQQSGSGGGGGAGGDGKKGDKGGEKKKYEPPVPTRVGKKRKKVKGKVFFLNERDRWPLKSLLPMPLIEPRPFK